MSSARVISSPAVPTARPPSVAAVMERNSMLVPLTPANTACHAPRDVPEVMPSREEKEKTSDHAPPDFS